MLTRLATLWEKIRTSLWALPLVVVLAAVTVAVIVVQFRLGQRSSPVWWLYSGDAAAASQFLQSLLTATVTMVTLAVSITMVVLTLAAQSLGPRIIPIFMGDNQTKIALGLFIGTGVYLLIILRTLGGNTGSVPNLAVTVGTALFLASVIGLVFFLNRLAQSIVADTIIERVGRSLDASAASLFNEDKYRRRADAGRPIAQRGKPFHITEGGYVQLIDHGSAVAAAQKANAVVALRFRPGHFMLANDVAGWIDGAKAGEENNPRDALDDAITRGAVRTPFQDVEYSIGQLADIALRALSSGINDPHTACNVVDRLATSLAAMMERGAIQGAWRDDDGVVRLLVPSSTFAGIADAAFNGIRQAAAGHPAVLIALVDRLGQLLQHANHEQAAALLSHIDKVEETGTRTIADACDRADFDARIAAARDSNRIA